MAFFRSVGETGFEPATPWSQTRCATGLRYFPNFIFRIRFPFGNPAVRAGFEPAEQFDPFGSLANYWYRPLTHLTFLSYLRASQSVSSELSDYLSLELECKDSA